MTCHACHGEIDGAPLLVPVFPRGRVAYCAKVACSKAAVRRARVAWPAMRKRPPRPA